MTKKMKDDGHINVKAIGGPYHGKTLRWWKEFNEIQFGEHYYVLQPPATEGGKWLAVHQHTARTDHGDD